MKNDRRPVRAWLLVLTRLALLGAGAAVFVVMQSRGVLRRNLEPGAVEVSAPRGLSRHAETGSETRGLVETVPALRKPLSAQVIAAHLNDGASALTASAETPTSATEPQIPTTEPPAVVAVKRTLEPLAAGHKDTRIAFVDCPQEPCAARVDARSLSELHVFLQEASAAYGGHVGIVVKERLDGFTGRWFEAHLEIGSTDAQPIPSLTEELAHLRD